MFGKNFYFGTLRNYIVLFGNLFNDVVITRTGANSEVVQAFKVPLSYAPKDKILARLDQDPNLDREAAIILPRMSFEMTNMYYDGNRKLNKQNRVTRLDTNDANKFKHQYSPVPYNINFTLYVYVKNAEDGTKIIEQIIPYFMPSFNVTANMIPEMNQLTDIAIELISIRSDDTYDGQFTERRALVWTLDFILKGYLWGPIYKKPMIKFANTQFFFGNGVANASEVVSTLTVQPGLDANGDPTSNVEITIPYGQIFEDDDWTYIVQQSGLIVVEDS